MPRAIWSGSISFGLVNVAVKVYSAVHDHGVHFHQIDKQTESRIRYEKVSEKSGKEVEAKDIELGYEISRGKVVIVQPERLAELRPRSTRTIDVTDFVELSEIDPIYYNRTYWLAPDGEAATRAYHLLVGAMEDRGRVGIGMVVMRNKQYLAAIRPVEGALALSTMRFADEVTPRKDLDVVPSRAAKPAAKELKLATQIIDSLAAPWKPENYHDSYTEEVRKLLKRRDNGDEIEVEEAPAPTANVADLTAALEASLASARKNRRPARSKRKTAARKAG
jgi:DNA end-binding protein Ku